jgi:peptidoglycan/xylan/chitin deacetylase (PgdA/CDA1 family)
MTMKRRSFVRALFGGVAGVGATCCSRQVVLSANAAVQRGAKPKVAVTFDDPRLDVESTLSPQQVNRRLLPALDERGLQTALFVCGRRVDSAAGQSLVDDWAAAGHLIAHHSYSHVNYHRTSYEKFAVDFVRNLPILDRVRRHENLFRYPMLKAGDTTEKRDRFRDLLRQHGYRDGAVTIDASDWYVDQRLRERLESDRVASLEPFRE